MIVWIRCFHHRFQVDLVAMAFDEFSPSICTHDKISLHHNMIIDVITLRAKETRNHCPCVGGGGPVRIEYFLCKNIAFKEVLRLHRWLRSFCITHLLTAL